MTNFTNVLITVKYERETKVSCQPEDKKKTQSESGWKRRMWIISSCPDIWCGWSVCQWLNLHLSPPRTDSASHPAVLIIHNIAAPGGHAYLWCGHRAIGEACVIIARPIAAHIWHITPKDDNRRGVNVFQSQPSVHRQWWWRAIVVKTGNIWVQIPWRDTKNQDWNNKKRSPSLDKFTVCFQSFSLKQSFTFLHAFQPNNYSHNQLFLWGLFSDVHWFFAVVCKS